MLRRDPTPRNRLVLGLVLSASGILLVAAGCDRRSFQTAGQVARMLGGGGPEREILRIACPWPRATRDEIERDFLAWLESAPALSGPLPRTARCIWIDLEPVDRPIPADVFLGGPVREYVRLARSGRLEPLSLPGNGSDPTPWLVARRSLVVLAGEESDGPVRMAFDDPRVSPPTLAWAAGRLRSGSWTEGYARLVRHFGRSAHSPGWRAGSARAAVERGEADGAVAVLPRPNRGDAESSDPEAIRFDEGAAVYAGATARVLARGFARFLVERRGARPGKESEVRRPGVDALLSDLLGSTLVDAREELVEAWAVLDRAEARDVSSPLLWMFEPPPWPPASVEKIRARGGERAEAMLADLAGQIAPDPGTKLALIQSWLRPRRLIDDAVLSELAGLVSGRLVDEPRFRSWLRAEWTAWARQRYRRVARLASGASHSPAREASGARRADGP
jgi:hypothetical protein